MFSFEQVSQSRNGETLTGSCHVAADMPCFNGHFPGLPIMPAAAQLEMIQALLRQHGKGNTVIAGGSKLRFTGRIQANDSLTIRLQRNPSGDIDFSVENRGAVVSKGNLQLAAPGTETVCALVPVYNNPKTIGKVVAGLQRHIKHIIIADDGSHVETRAIIDQLAAHDPAHIHVLHLPVNRGKGTAVKAGLQRALDLGFNHALQVDADGQHDLGDIPRFLEHMRTTPDALILGAPQFGADIPAIRKYGRKLTTLMIAIEAGTLTLPDAMCGFRLYPVAATCALHTLCARMCFDPEIMIRAYWAGIPVRTVPTRVRYLSAEEGGVSHFRGVHDNVLNVGLHTCLVLQAPLRWLLRYIKVRKT